MRLLFDTQLLVWAKKSPQRLPARAAGALLDTNHTPLFSTVSIWELAIKHSLRRGDGSVVDPRLLRSALLESGYVELDMTAQHALAVADLPLHHRDPFDRLLIAQARVEGLPLLTVDKVLARYGDPVVIVG